MQTKVIAIASFKGGVGKTTQAVHLGLTLAQANKPTLLVDLDGQGNATDHFMTELVDDNGNPIFLDANAYHLITDRRSPEDCIYKTSSLDIIPATLDVAMASVQMMGDHNAAMSLRDVLHDLGYEYVIIDTPPSWGYSVKAGLYASDLVLTPTDLKRDSLKGLAFIRSILDMLFSEKINLPRPKHVALPSNVTEKQAYQIRSILAGPEYNYEISEIAITKSIPLDSTMTKKRPLDPDQSKSEAETAKQYQLLSEEVA